VARVRAGVLGMGRMGQAIAARLLEGGHDVAVWNRSPGRTADLAARGATVASTPAAAVASSEVVLTSLANDGAVRAVALGDDGIAAHIGDQVFVEASTISPALSQELTDRFPHFIAMPVVGNPDAVRAGRAVLLVGGGDHDIGHLAPILDSLSPTIRRYPEARLANVAKLTTNMLLLSGVVALAESLAVGRRGGLDDGQLAELLSESPMLAPGLKNRFDTILTGSGPTWWTLDLGAKDARLAVELAHGVELPLLAVVRSQFDAAAHEDPDDAGSDIAAVSHRYRS